MGDYQHSEQYFQKDDVVRWFESLSDLSACEQAIFSEFLRPGLDILDLGIGGGRTCPHLAQNARRYVGVDYELRMVEAARRKFPKLELLQGDAADLSGFEGRSFDVVVFSHNGIDCLEPHAKRHAFLREAGRMLRPGGLLIYSSHNPRMLLPRNLLSGATIHHWIYHAKWLFAMLRWPAAAWHGKGYLFEPARGGMICHSALPQHAIVETEPFGFQLQKVFSNEHPSRPPAFMTSWWYYVFKRVVG